MDYLVQLIDWGEGAASWAEIGHSANAFVNMKAEAGWELVSSFPVASPTQFGILVTMRRTKGAA